MCDYEQARWQSFMARVKKDNPLHTIIMWAIIAGFVLPAGWFCVANYYRWQLGFGTACILTAIIVIGRFYNMEAKAFLQVLAVLVAGAGLFFHAQQLEIQTKGISLQGRVLQATVEQMQLETRPLLSVDILPRFWNDQKTSYFGANVRIVNSGRFPAMNVHPQYVISNDTGKTDDFEKWYADTYGAFPNISFVAANSTAGPIPLTPRVPPEAEFTTIGVVISYEQMNVQKKYWHMARKTYRLVKDDSGRLKEIVPVEDVQSFSKNDDTPPPTIILPEWHKFTYGKIPI